MDTAAGWGSTFSGGSVVQILRDVKLSLTSNSTCTGFYGTSYDANTMICYGIQGDNIDTCQVNKNLKVKKFWYSIFFSNRVIQAVQ